MQQFGDLGYFVMSVCQVLCLGSLVVIDVEVRWFQEVYGIEVMVFDFGGFVWVVGDYDGVVFGDEDVEWVKFVFFGCCVEQLIMDVFWGVVDVVLVELVFDDGDVIGVVFVFVDVEVLCIVILQQFLFFVVIVFVLIVFGVFLVFWLVWWVLLLVGCLDEVMVVIECGEMDVCVVEDVGLFELWCMVQVFNGMVDQIEWVMMWQQEFVLNVLYELCNLFNVLLLCVEYFVMGLGFEWWDDIEEMWEEG